MPVVLSLVIESAAGSFADCATLAEAPFLPT
jgi:hypothetical protein